MCLNRIFHHYKQSYSLSFIAEILQDSNPSIRNICEAFETTDYKTLAVQLDYDDLKEVPLPAMILLNHGFSVLESISDKKAKIFHPAYGEITFERAELIHRMHIPWIDQVKTQKGYLVLIEPKAIKKR